MRRREVIVAGALVTFLSWIGIPASLGASATACIVGLGWDRATRAGTLIGRRDSGGHGREAARAVGWCARGQPRGRRRRTAHDRRTAVGEEDAGELTAAELFDPRTTGRVVTPWLLTPTISAAASYPLFSPASA